MTEHADNFCTHCRLPLGLRPMQRTLDGELCSFCCYGCCIAFQVKTGRNEEFEATWLLIRLGVGGFLSMNVMLISLVIYAGAFDADAWLIPWIHLLLWIFATPALIILGEPYLRETIANARQGRLTSSALVVLGVSAAYAYSVFATIEQSQQVYFDTATMVLMLFTLGSYIEAAGRAKAARDLEPLLAAESECGTVVENGTEIRRPVREIGPGTLVRVRPGERVPVDGVVVEGESYTDEAVITGESRRVVKGVGSTMIAGSVNLDGPLLVESSSAGTATRWAKICRSVREALSRPSPLQRVADRMVGMSVPLVLVLGMLTTFLWANSLPFDRALLAGLAVLVVACPCAVGLAAPLATSLGIGRLARSGCLVREPAALEALGRSRLIAFDKTGTLTSGTPRIVDADLEGAEYDEVLALRGRIGAPLRTRVRARDHYCGWPERCRTSHGSGRSCGPRAWNSREHQPSSGGGRKWRLHGGLGLAGWSRPRRACAGARCGWSFVDLCRLGRSGSCCAGTRRYAPARSALDDRAIARPRAACDDLDG